MKKHTAMHQGVGKTTKPALGALTVADQSVLHFSNEEVRLIDAALKR